jgi:hypothetical protein
VQLDADRVLVVVGFRGEQLSDTTEMLHLSTLTVTPGPDMHSARHFVLPSHSTLALDASAVTMARLSC